MNNFNSRFCAPHNQVFGALFVLIMSMIVLPSFSLAEVIDFKQHVGKEGFHVVDADHSHVHFTFSVSRVRLEEVVINGEMEGMMR